MVFNVFSRNHKTANIVIKDHVIRFIELKQLSPVVVSHYGERFIPEGLIRDGKIIDRETLETILEQCVEEWGIKKRNVRFVVPDQYVVIRTLQVPSDLHDDEIKGYLYIELGSTIHLPFEDPVFDILVTGDSREKKTVLLFAAPEDIVMQYSTLFEELKLKPIAADISPLCMYRLYHEIDHTKSKDHTMILQFDLHMVNISIFHHHKPVFMRHLSIDGAHEQWESQNTRTGNIEFKWIGEENELLLNLLDTYKEIEHVMNFYRFSLNQGKEGISRIFLCGDHPYLSTIYREVKERSEVQVDTINSEHFITSDGDLLDSNLHLALGLALKEVR